MKVSEGVPRGRIAEQYYPDMFKEHEEVIIFTRDEFNRTYTHMIEQIDYINKIYMYMDPSEEWKLIGYWPKIMERVHLLDRNMDLIFEKEPLQCYLDTYLYSPIRNVQEKAAVSKSKGISKIGATNLDSLF